jgi:hypothetical protein
VAIQEKLVAAEGWIMDGDLGPYDAVEVRLRAADTIIFLDFSLEGSEDGVASGVYPR